MIDLPSVLACMYYKTSMSKIAIIEDDPVINQMYRMKFEAAGFDVQLADSGKSGVALIESFHPDIVLLDLQMPEKDGVDVLKDVRAMQWAKDLPVLILTNLGEEESPDELKKLGISGYVVKADHTPSQVVERVKEVLAA